MLPLQAIFCFFVLTHYLVGFYDILRIISFNQLILKIVGKDKLIYFFLLVQPQNSRYSARVIQAAFGDAAEYLVAPTVIGVSRVE